MNVELLNTILQQKEKAKTVYFNQRQLACEENDICIFHFLHYCIVNRSSINNEEEMKSMLDIRTPAGFKTYFVVQWTRFIDQFSDEHLSDFELASLSKKVFKKVLTKPEIERIFYRMTWFIQCLSYSCISSPDIRGFIAEISTECAQLDSLGNTEVAYFELGKYDNIALLLLQSFHDDGISFSDLPVEFFSKFEALTGKIPFEESLKESLLAHDIQATLATIERADSYFAKQFLVFNVAKWQIELELVSSNWFVKIGPFSHLKRYLKKILWQ